MAETLSHPDEVVPGTTVPIATSPLPSLQASSSQPSTSHPGPSINNHPTALTLHHPSQLATSPCLSALTSTINTAFAASGKTHKILGASLRLRHPTQLLDELGTDSSRGTFTYVLTRADDDDPHAVLGTISAQRYVVPVLVAEQTQTPRGADETGRKAYQTFTRFEVPAAACAEAGGEAEMWEVKLMAVEPAVQGRGVASFLMRMVEEEVRRRVSGRGKARCLLLLTAILEVNGTLYERKGYVCEDQRVYDVGHMGSERAFTVGFYSKVLGTG